jgi:hypothetical protein
MRWRSVVLDEVSGRGAVVPAAVEDFLGDMM